MALALAAQATDFGGGLIAFALVPLPVACFLGVTMVVRFGQVNLEDARWLQWMNRIRHAYLELELGLERYFVTSRYDNQAGLLQSLIGERVRYRWSAAFGELIRPLSPALGEGTPADRRAD